MKMTAEVALSVAIGLRGLDGYERIVKDGANEKVVIELYKLGSGLRLLIAMNLNKLDEFQRNHQRVLQTIQLGTQGPDGKPDASKFADSIAAQHQLSASEHDFDLRAIKIVELKLDENPIPATVLSLLVPLLEE